MEVQDLPGEKMISNLPPNIIQTILTLMPIRDAFRTSILSKKWRYHCFNIPKLVFNDAVFQGPSCRTAALRWKLLYVVYPILLLHEVPILEFSLSTPQLISCSQIDQILLHLSRSATLKKLTLCVKSGDDHKLQSAFFKLQELTVLELQKCVFHPPVTFKGFSKLVTLSFNNVSITSEVFLRVMSNCPMLKSFTLIGDEKHLWNCGVRQLFDFLPLLEHLCMSLYPIKCFATGGVVSQDAMNPVNYQDYSYVISDHLRVIEIRNFINMKTGMDFVKFILAKSPMLNNVNIEIDRGVDIHGEVKMQKELLRYPRASARAEIRLERA